ncbi:protocadherin Fat 4 [Asbolus verrucosus]|uniref:Protocadherin Fat 4 n=1 Tax=Asbolus verrucosus TaxID=1661398 RepID=A0A482WAC6_ASBVE|nr:protocadherin Fat 4 [Asbolus verrucosus]
MKENISITVDNGCKFMVSDPDGFLSTLDFTDIISSDKDESNLFKFVFSEVPADDVHESEVYLVLQDGKMLDYEEIVLYSFHVKAKDHAGHATTPIGSVQIIVQVEDVGDTPPIWQTFTSMKRVTEKTEETLTIVAKDGDYGIANKINYRLDNPNIETKKYIEMDTTTGKITINPIDRDRSELTDDKIEFTVVAYEIGDEDSTLTDSITIMVDDVDDSIPEISVPDSSEKKLDIKIKESSNAISDTIIVNDRDLGDNAMYTIELVSTSRSTDYTTAFQVIPTRGYEQTTVSLAITAPDKLDYEDEAWRNIAFTLVTKGTKNEANSDSLPITISLIDINDEAPQFSSDAFTAEVPENIKNGEIITSIKATDKDAVDAGGVKHELLGKMANSILKIEELGGNVIVIKDNAFDYEKQTEVFVQIRATDSGGNSNMTQLTITVKDLNDEPPRLVVSSTITIDENEKEGTVLETNIIASDNDATANLEFEIDWVKSYATKNSALLEDKDQEKFKCIQVDTVTGATNQEVSAKLSIINITPDYELFDTLFIYLTVTDKATEINKATDSAVVVININNKNDNWPVFLNGTDTVERYVTENSAHSTVIGVVTATDDDKLLTLNYSIQSADANTPNWVGIDRTSGALFVNLVGDDVIDCDAPLYLEILTYTVTVTDGEHDAEIDITINIIDQNDNPPKLNGTTITNICEDDENSEESQDGNVIFELEPEDIDRDTAYKTVRCTMQSTADDEVTRRFKVEDNKIKISLEGAELNREEISEFSFQLNCVDDPTHQGVISNPVDPPPVFKIVLCDVNDKYPTITTTEGTPISESTGEVGFILIVVKYCTGVLQTIEAEDDDEGVKGEISFKIATIQRYRDKDHTIEEEDQPPQNLFEIKADETHKNAILSLTGNLTGYYGYLLLTINATDGGSPPLSKLNQFDIEIKKYNFFEPKFNFPVCGEKYFLLPTQTPMSRLKLYNDDLFGNINATDQQGEKFTFIFSIPNSDDSNNLFTIKNMGNSLGELQMTTSNFDSSKTFQITITASIDTTNEPTNGEAAYSSNCSISFQFFDLDDDPVFDKNETSFDFRENDIDAHQELEEPAHFLVDISLPVYYLLSEGPDFFKIDINTGAISLSEKLDYETQTSHTIVIQSSKGKTIDPDASANTKLKVTINVIDVNDEAPVFEFSNYYGPILTGTQTADILKVYATDVDQTSTNQLRYKIENIEASTDSLKAIKDPFGLNEVSGLLTLNFQVKDTMKGYFTLTISVQDEPPEYNTDRTTAKIYVVTADNTVNFKFGNSLEVVNNKTDDITEILNKEFPYNSNVETAKSQTPDDDSGEIISVAPIYFINMTSIEPIAGSEILKSVTNVDVFNRLKTNFSNAGLNLLNFQTGDSSDDNLEAMLKAWLIGISVVLGSLCIILLIAFLLKTRALNKRIKNLSSTKFGSQESGLNRQGVAAPTTNKHAVEGSNPVYNNEIDTTNIERVSVTSGDSDLIGVEDDSKFDYDYPSKNEIIE